ncbi:MAG: hypothetical protein RL431_1019 [Actinomycetota bacterium]|jgi:hypothetical protein
MRKQPRRPVLFEPAAFDNFVGDHDPALRLQVAHDTAAALVSRVRAGADPEVVERLVSFTRDHGVDELAELWASAPAHSLPGALWRLYVVHASIVSDPGVAAESFRAGFSIPSIDGVVVGAPQPTGPDEVKDLADEILTGVFVGDLPTALDRAASYCRISAHGLVTLAHQADDEAGSPFDDPSRLLAAHDPVATQSTERTHRAAVLAGFAVDFSACAALARQSPSALR